MWRTRDLKVAEVLERFEPKGKPRNRFVGGRNVAKKNWIAIYSVNGGPKTQTKATGVFAWAYAPQPKGTKRIDVTGLQPGDYKVYFLADGGYKWLADPLTIKYPLPIASGSTISFRQETNALAFDYTVSSASVNVKNWIAIYQVIGGPLNQEKTEAPITWVYAPSSKGTAKLSLTGLRPGQYKAYFLAAGEYTWLSEPITIAYTTNPLPPVSIISKTTSASSEASTSSKTTTSSTSSTSLTSLTSSSPQTSTNSTVFTSSTLPIPDSTSISSSSPTIFSEGPVTLYTKPILLKTGRVGDPYEVSVNGFVGGLLGASSISTQFSLNSTTAPSWVNISSDGIMSGIPDAITTPEIGSVTVFATGSNGVVGQFAVDIPVVATGAAIVEHLKVLTWNMWFGGTRVIDYHQKQVNFLATSDIDIVILEETLGRHGRHGARLATALGWNYWQSDRSVSVISRYPIVDTYPSFALEHGGAVRVAIDGTKIQVNVWAVHLHPEPYGVYELVYLNGNVTSVLAVEEASTRAPQLRQTLGFMSSQLANSDNIPVLFGGDFNSPSHLDWTVDTVGNHLSTVIPWTTSKLAEDAGLIDSFREAHPDPVSVPGETWSAIYKTYNYKNETLGRPEPQDRIDYIYYRGKLEVESAEALVIGNPSPIPNHENNEWTSDHKAVLVKYNLSQYINDAID